MKLTNISLRIKYLDIHSKIIKSYSDYRNNCLFSLIQCSTNKVYNKIVVRHDIGSFMVNKLRNR